MWTAKKVQIKILTYSIIILISHSMISCSVAKATISNTSDAIYFAKVLNSKLIEIYDDEVYKNCGVKAFAINNGVIIYTDKYDHKAKNSEFANITEELYQLAGTILLNDCGKTSSLSFFFVQVKHRYYCYLNKERLNQLCKSWKLLPHQDYGDLTDEQINSAITIVFNERLFCKNFGEAERGKSFIIEPEGWID